MHTVRSLIYRLGFRPKPRTILYSPSLDYLYQARGTPKAIREALTHAIRDSQEHQHDH